MQLYANELHDRYSDMRFMTTTTEELFESDGGSLERLVSFMGLPSRPSLVDARRSVVDGGRVRTSIDVDWREIFGLPKTIEVAQALGYDANAIDAQALEKRYRIGRIAAQWQRVRSHRLSWLPRSVEELEFERRMQRVQWRQGQDRAGVAPSVLAAISEHQQRVHEVLPSGDSESIKGLYIELGGLLQSSTSESSSVPVLSFPETGPVVAALFGRTQGWVLDAGCGPNPMLSILLGETAGRSMVGIDIGLGTVRLAREQALSLGVRFFGVVADIEALPFRDASFDGAVCEDTIEHLPDDRAGIKELRRVLRSGGQLVLGTPNRIRLDVLLARARDRLRGVRRDDSAYFATSSHLREYSWRQLELLVRTHFRVDRRATIGWEAGWKARFASALVRYPVFRAVGRMVILDLIADRPSTPV
jgi:SAM-dependent methyltransferase